MTVEDREAFETTKVLLLYLDSQGHVIRQPRIDVTGAQQVSGAWVRASWCETPEWKDASMGAEYQDGRES